MSPASVLWLRRDLRLADHPALLAAASAAGGAGVAPLFVLDPALLGPAGPARTAWLLRSLAAWDAATDGALLVRSGDPATVVPAVAAELGAASVHVTADAGPYGRRRDDAVAAALEADDRALVRTGTPYAIGPGTLLTGAGHPFQVYSPFARAWAAHGVPDPAPGLPAGHRWVRRLEGEQLPAEPDLGEAELPEAGEAAALARWAEFLDSRVDDYDTARDRPDLHGTSQLSAALKYGEVHPRTLLADLAARSRGGRASKGVEVFRSELVWRDFYADVLWSRPETAREYYRPQLAGMRYERPGAGAGRALLQAWAAGRTGYPFVDAGMRQLLAEGWVHNRVRMVVASFLVKDLHLEWTVGARHFMRHLRDGDLASNNHGWQWVAGSGTDAAPYFRVFNPVAQGQRYDPAGEYVRRYVPELAHVAGKAVHEPWKAPGAYDHGYPQPVVDHAAERAEALARYAAVREG